jgi:hypothetical protein
MSYSPNPARDRSEHAEGAALAGFPAGHNPQAVRSTAVLRAAFLRAHVSVNGARNSREWTRGSDFLDEDDGIGLAGGGRVEGEVSVVGRDAGRQLLRAGQAGQWTEEWFNGHGLYRLRGTIRYPGAA